eukprot:m.109714 g.109714  ORF g.109714 m.109714 type:complete len:1474 (+) comp9049_c0_seq5:48-4469(+)
MDDFCGSYWGMFSNGDDQDYGFTSVDFGICFEDVVISSVPTAFIIFVGLIRLIYLWKVRPTHMAHSSKLFLAKQVFGVFVAGLLAAEVAYRIWNHDHDAEIVSASVMFLGTVLAILLLHIEHSKWSLSSGVLTLFWMLAVLADGVRVRTMAIRYMHDIHDDTTLVLLVLHLFFALVSFLLSCFLEPAFYSALPSDEHKACPEYQAPLFSRLSFWWMGPLMQLGYKKSLVDEDLWGINMEDTTANLTTRFFNEWNKERAKADPSLIMSLARAFGPPFYIGGVLKFFQDMLGFVGPLLLSQLINYVSDPDTPSWKGYGLAVVLLAAAELQSILLHQYFHRVMTVGMRLRSSVIAAVYNKALVLSTSAKQSTTTGEMVNLMAVDAQRFMDLTSYLHMIWSAPIQIGLSLFFLWDLMGYAILGGVGVMVLMIPLNGFIAKRTRTQQVAQMAQKDQRIKLMNEVLNGIKVIKLYAWEIPYNEFVGKVREKELKVLMDTSYLNAISMFSWSCAPFFVSLVTFIIYTAVMHEDLTADKAFVSLSLFNILRFPMTMLPMLISSLVEAQVSVNRLKKFLLLPEMNPDNVIRHNAPAAYHGKLQPAVSVARGYFSWASDSPPILRDIDFSVMPSTLVAVVGQVGSGKSSLISALLGDMEKKGGSVTIPMSTAYVPQQAWIQNATVRDNILFGLPFDPQRYAQTISACALEADLLILPAGDLTEIGEKGINLSGGQKQRVSLARAVYQACDCYLLDDPLSAVDAHVGKHIFDHVIGPHGLLQNKTRILVTHGIHFLSQTHKVIVLREGRIAEQGPYLDLLSANGDFSRFVAEHTKEETKEGTVELEGESSTDPEPVASTTTTTTAPTVTNVAPTTTVPAPVTEVKSSKGKDDGAKLIAKEGVNEGDVQGAVYKSYFRANGYGYCTVILMLYLISFGASIGSNIWLSVWSGDPSAEKFTTAVYLGVYAALGMGNSIGILVVTLVSAYAAVSASRSMHAKMLTAVMRSPMAFFDTTPLGRIVNRFSKDVYAIDETIPRSLRSYITTALQVLSIIVVISYSTPLFMVAILPMGLLYYWIQRYYIATSRQLQRLESVSRSPIYALFSETLNGVSSIRAYNRQAQFTATNESKVDGNMTAYYPSICANRWLALRLEFVGNCIIFFAALFAVIDRGSIDPGLVGLSLSYAMSVTQTLNWMVRMSTQLESDIVAVERVEEYIQLPSEAPLFLEHRPASDWPATGSIRFDNFALRYRPGLDLVLRNLTCDVRGGEKIGIVGRTGAGKSSLTLSLFRLVEPAGGRIAVDGEDIAKLGLQDLRANLTVMPQDPVLFCGTVRDNLDPFHVYSDQRVWTALETCRLRPFIETLGGGLESRVSEGGENFSVGQRQLLCLARAVLRKTKVLVLDEATAAVDLETDQFIQRTIRSEFQDCTVLTIAHRINTILDCDRVMVLDKGEIVEFDSPSALFEHPASIFRGMCLAAGITMGGGIQ